MGKATSLMEDNDMAEGGVGALRLPLLPVGIDGSGFLDTSSSVRGRLKAPESPLCSSWIGRDWPMFRFNTGPEISLFFSSLVRPSLGRTENVEVEDLPRVTGEGVEELPYGKRLETRK